MDEARRSRKDERAALHQAWTTLHGLTASYVTTIKINLRVSDMSDSLICLPLTPPPSTLLSPLHPFLPPPLLQQWSATAVKAPVGQHQRKTRRLVARQQQQKITMRARACASVAHMCVCVCTCESVNH